MSRLEQKQAEMRERQRRCGSYAGAILRNPLEPTAEVLEMRETIKKLNKEIQNLANIVIDCLLETTPEQHAKIIKRYRDRKGTKP